ncbi:MAG TPA: tRNA1(Val) (adenine(37)-N6)-methyltransferase [Clostridia bacterium]|jgi:tRNA1(Val) A37 N6-methylase TrmN6|nr:tRNA1(Val) (adenine(37)-N6)-methyltransferase [Clostridia bacterium]
MLNGDEIILDLQCDGLRLIQSPTGYCFTTDAVLLSSMVRASAKENILELGSGSGVISILLSKKTTAKKIIGIEIQKRLYEMSLRSLKINNLEDRVCFINDDIKNVVKRFGGGSFNVIVVNPPYEKAQLDREATERDIAKFEVLISLEEIISASASVLKNGGRFYMVIKASRLGDVFYHMKKHGVEPKRLVPVQAKKDSPIEICLIEGKKQGKSGVIIEAPIILQNELGETTQIVEEIYASHRKI